LEFLVIVAFLIAAYFVLRSFENTDDPNSKEDPPETKLDESSTFRPFDHQEIRPDTSTQTITGAAYIVDGDTLVIRKTQIRIFGVDAPEIDHPYGKKAKWALHALCKGQKIRAEIVAEDKHGRMVARCFLPDGRNLSAEMVKQGMAIDWPKFSGGKYSSLETADARKKMWLADARQKGRLHVWKKFESRQKENRKQG